MDFADPGQCVERAVRGNHLTHNGIGIFEISQVYNKESAKSFLTSPDLNYREKVDGLLRVLHSLCLDEMLFFIYEIGPMRVKKYGGRTYAEANDSPMYPQTQSEKGSISMAGALSATTNQVT